MVNRPDGKVVVAQMGTCRSRPTPTVCGTIIMEEIGLICLFANIKLRCKKNHVVALKKLVVLCTSCRPLL